MILKDLIKEMSLSDIAKVKNQCVESLYRDLIREIVSEFVRSGDEEVNIDSFDGVPVFKTEGAWENHEPHKYNGNDQYSIEAYLKQFKNGKA